MHNFTIRKAKITDHNLIVHMQQEMAWESEKLKLDSSKINLGVKAVLEDSNKGYYLIAEVEFKAIAVLLVLQEWSDWRNATVLWIHSLYVSPNFRRQGVFEKMYQFLKNQVNESNDLCGIRLYVEKNNLSAQIAYEKVGMSEDHYNMYEWLKNS